MDYMSEKAKNLIPYIAGIQPAESGWIKLNTNENPYPPSPSVAEALKNADMSRLNLYPDSASSELCKAIAANIGVCAENIFAGNGSDEVLALAFQAFFMGKGNILTPDISYSFYPVWCRMYDVGAKYLPPDADLSVNVSDYKNGSGVIIANPNAPTGIALSLEEIEEIVKDNPGGVVIIDEAYIDFANVKSAVGLIDRYDNLLVTRTFSKSYSLAGLRVGFAVGNKALIEALQRVKDSFNSYPLGMLAQIGAKAAIEDVGYWDEARSRIIHTREHTAAKLRKLGLGTTDSQANFLFAKAEDAKGLYEYLYESKILVRHWDKPIIDGFLRVTIGTEDEMEAFIKCIEKRMKQK